jgi:hypothetical protein
LQRFNATSNQAKKILFGARSQDVFINKANTYEKSIRHFLEHLEFKLLETLHDLARSHLSALDVKPFSSVLDCLEVYADYGTGCWSPADRFLDDVAKLYLDGTVAGLCVLD